MKFRNMCIYVLFAITIFSLFRVPEILLANEERRLESTTYAKAETQSKIDVEAEKIYLVKAIHNVEKNKKVAISSTRTTGYIASSENSVMRDEIRDKLQKLINYNVLENMDLQGEATEVTSHLSKTYGDGLYIINDEILATSDGEIHMEIENKTGLILNLLIREDKIPDRLSEREILVNYMEYLGLYIIDDWIYEEDLTNGQYFLESAKTDLKIGLSMPVVVADAHAGKSTESDEYVSISIHTNSLFDN